MFVAKFNLKFTRREFTRNAGYALLSASGLAALSPLTYSNSSSPTSPTPSSGGDGLKITVGDYTGLAQVGGLASFTYSGVPIYIFCTGDFTFSALSRICTHQGCEVSWVSASKKLACPCHGSQSSQQGVVLVGPANRALQKFSTSYDTATDTLTNGA